VTPGALLALALAAAPLAPAEAVREMETLLRRSFPASEPGAAAVVVKGKKVLLRRGLGLADVERRTPVTPETAFRVGSITKGFTAAAVLLLAQDGRLSLADPLSRRVAGWSAPNGDPTLAQVLAHVGGVGTDAPGRALEFAPGTRYAYSGAGYVLAGLAVEQAAGRPWAEVVRARLTGPLGMRSTGLEDAPGVARGYVREGAGFTAAPAFDAAAYGAAGGLRSTVDDLVRWDAALRAGKPLTPASVARLRTPATLADGTSTRVGLGWAVGELLGRITAEHGGVADGYTAYQLSIPAEGLFVAVLTNRENADPVPATIAADLAALALGERPALPRAVAAGPGALDAVAGTYGHGGARRIVRREGETLTLERPAASAAIPVRTLVPVGPDAFESAELRRVRFTFVRGPAGAVEALRIRAATGPEELLPRIVPRSAGDFER